MYGGIRMTETQRKENRHRRFVCFVVRLVFWGIVGGALLHSCICDAGYLDDNTELHRYLNDRDTEWDKQNRNTQSRMRQVEESNEREALARHDQEVYETEKQNRRIHAEIQRQRDRRNPNKLGSPWQPLGR